MIIESRGGVDLDAWGVERGYWDVTGQWHDTPPNTLETVLDAMGATAEHPPEDSPLVTVGEHGPWPGLPAGEIVLESGERRPFDPTASDVLPIGYHKLFAARTESSSGEAGPGRTFGGRTVAVCPPRCPAPGPGKGWGWAVQLYAVRSASSWGIGDFRDLRRLVAWAGRAGASFVLLNPLHAPAPGMVPEASPYFPSSRCFLSPLYICVDDVAGAGELSEVTAIGDSARRLNGERLIDRAAVWEAKSKALELLFDRFEASGAFAAERDELEQFCRDGGHPLDGYTSFCALAETHGLPWHDWPEEVRHPDMPAVLEFASGAHAGRRKRFYAWLQWLCWRQLRAASDVDGAGIMCDLAVGVDGGGADAWLWQDLFALGMRVGAPPDDYNRNGQDWGLPPWDPWKLRAGAYEPYLTMLRAAMGPARGMRADHVMGLFRLFWVPLGASPADGAYVRSVWQDMVGLLRLEAARAGAYVVGEDLGTVEDHVRQVLSESGVLSYRLFWFEPGPPQTWPEQALGALTTHDLPTVVGAWTGADVAAAQSIGLPVNEEGCASMKRRLEEWGGSDGSSSLQDVVVRAYESLAKAPCSLLAATLDDALLVEERPNMPSTVDQWPNWRLGLPAPLEEVETNEVAAAIARALNRR
ncbi:MAG TPA: 4-alpha-glucanotransferase [Acidimicrobiales bacterium]|nr:4-alpha-glucanotransferase [Acidimicrobiales bacterium]